MTKVLHAARFALICQLVASIALIGAIWFSVSLNIFETDPLHARSEVFCIILPSSNMTFAVAEVLLAIGVILSSHRHLDIIAASIRSSPWRIDAVNPSQAARMLRANLWLGSLAFALLAFKPPMDIICRVLSGQACACVGEIAWPALMSLGLASVGAIAHAAEKSPKL